MTTCITWSVFAFRDSIERSFVGTEGFNQVSVKAKIHRVLKLTSQVLAPNSEHYNARQILVSDLKVWKN